MCPSVGAAPMGAPGAGLCRDVWDHSGGATVRPVMPRHPWNSRAAPCPGRGWRRVAMLSGARPQPAANAEGDPCGPDVLPHRGSPIPAAPASASSRRETRGETRREPDSGQGNSNSSPPPTTESGQGSVAGRFGRQPARCHRPAEPGCGGPGWRPRGCSLARAGLTAPPGRSTPSAGRGQRGLAGGAGKVAPVPVPRPEVAPPAGGEPGGSRGSNCPRPDSLPAFGVVGSRGSAGCQGKGWEVPAMFLAAFEKGVGLRAAGCRPPRSHGHAATACARQTKGACSSALYIQGRVPRDHHSAAATGRGVCGEGPAPACGSAGAGRKGEGRPRTR